MGSYTNTLRYYKPVSNEVVDVEQHLNYNWDINDLQMKRLLEYEYVSGQNPNVVGALSRSRFYKEYSNTIQAYFRSSPDFFWQDPSAFASAWVNASSLITGGGGGYDPHPSLPPAYRTIKKSGGSTAEIEWTGALWQGGSQLTIGTNFTVMVAGTLPAAIRPVVTKYFDVWGGNTASDYCVGRLLIGNDGRMEFKLYGIDPPSMDSEENRLEFTGIIYNVEVTGV